jgi:hypothetical protein
MSRQNVEVARRLWDRIVEAGRTQRAGTGLADPAWHPDVEYIEDPRWHLIDDVLRHGEATVGSGLPFEQDW